MAYLNYNRYQISTFQFGSSGNYATVNDTYQAAVPGSAYPDVTIAGQPLNPPGCVIRIIGNNAVPIVLRYVRYDPTANVTLSASNVPGLVYWKDTGQINVTPTPSESVIGAVTGAEAGILLNSGVTNGNWTIIQTGGYLPACNVPAGTAVGDWLTGLGGSPTPLVLARIGNGLALTSKAVAIAWSAVSGGLSNIYLLLDSI